MKTQLLACLALSLALLACVGPAVSAPSTSRGNISVAQVVEMIEKAPADEQSLKVSMAYLFGLGETMGYLFTPEHAAVIGLTPCKTAFSLDTTAVLQALRVAAPDESKWTETLATPIIVRDMLARAGCGGGF